MFKFTASDKKLVTAPQFRKSSQHDPSLFDQRAKRDTLLAMNTIDWDMIGLRTSSDKDQRVLLHFDDTTRAWNAWKRGDMSQKTSTCERYIVSKAQCTKMHLSRIAYGGGHEESFDNRVRQVPIAPVDVPPLVKIAPEMSLNCGVCRKYQGQLYPCRVCGKVYHQHCVKDIADVQPNQLNEQLIKHALTLLGWSCPTCEDLRSLLPPEELAETNEWLNSLGSQSTFSLDTYIDTRLKSNSSRNFGYDQLNTRLKAILQIFLNSNADVTSNRMSRPELISLDVSLKLIRLPPTILVNALTPLELYRLSRLFVSLSSFASESVTYDKFCEVFTTYLMATVPDLIPVERDLHIEALAYTFLNDMAETDRTWARFLLDATIPTLLGRYNHRPPLDFINRIIHKQRPNDRTLSAISQLQEPNINTTSGQSSPLLIDKVLQRLQQSIAHKIEQTKVQRNAVAVKAKASANEKFRRY